MTRRLTGEVAAGIASLDPRRLEGLLKLDEEIALLHRTRQKRQMTVDRRTRRDQRHRSLKFSERYVGNREHDY